MKSTPDEDELQILRNLLLSSTLSEEEQELMNTIIDECVSYDEFQRLQYSLEELQPSIDEIPSPGQKDITKHLQKL